MKVNFECSKLMFLKLTKLVKNVVAKLCDRFSVSLFLVTNMLNNFCWHAACIEFLTINEKKVITVCQLWTKTKCFSNRRNHCGFWIDTKTLLLKS